MFVCACVSVSECGVCACMYVCVPMPVRLPVFAALCVSAGFGGVCSDVFINQTVAPPLPCLG